MARSKRKCKCLNCREYFRPDPKNIGKQTFCSKTDCRKASKAAAQARWLAKEENKNYFKGPDNVKRVQQWRKNNPGYWKKGQTKKKPLQDLLTEKKEKKQQVTGVLEKDALQDLLKPYHAVLIGLIAKFTGVTLQDDIAQTTSSLQQLGSDILNSSTLIAQGGKNGYQNPDLPRPYP